MDKKTLEGEFRKIFYEARIGDHDKARIWRWITANYISKTEHEQQLKQVEKLCEIYFKIASEETGEDIVRSKRDLILKEINK